jgi:septal ring factor EnvC (AmiA/AmiB activator)
LATALAVGLLIAHFRDALAFDLEDAPRMALDSLRENPLGLREVHSWALFGVSVLFAFIALADSYGLDDAYPGYGALDRRRKQLLDDYALELEDVRQELQDLKDESLRELDRALAEARTTLYALHEAIEHKVATEARLRNALADVDNGLDTLLGMFRDLNRLHRSSPCPGYFAERPVLAELPWPDFSVERDRRKYAEQTALLNRLVERIEGMRGAIQSSFVRHHDGLKPLDRHFEPAPGKAP